MKRSGLLASLALFLLLPTIPVQGGQQAPCTFLSPLRHTGTQWQVKSAIGPVYLARLEGGAWRTLACFDGTNGTYFLTWENPRQGVYAAVDPNGACSELVAIGQVPASGRTQRTSSPAIGQPASGRWVFQPAAGVAARSSSR